MKNNNKGYSVIIALLITGFLLLLVVGVFNLVLKELKDTRAMGDYYKAYYGAESAQELALLKIKEKGYGIDENIEFSINDSSVVLSKNPIDKDLFNPKLETYISYSLNTKTDSYSGELDSLGYDIIPLFYIDSNSVEHKITNLDFNVDFGNSGDLVWNILSKDGGISGTGEFDGNVYTDKKDSNFSFINESSISIKSFLNNNDTNYLILFNTGELQIKYNIGVVNTGEFFSKPKTYIISSAKVGDYRQNFRTYLNNTEYLNILKYSIYSN